MKLSILEIIVLGRKYINLWPSRTELGEYFADYQAVRMSRLVCKITKLTGHPF